MRFVKIENLVIVVPCVFWASACVAVNENGFAVLRKSLFESPDRIIFYSDFFGGLFYGNFATKTHRDIFLFEFPFV